MEIQTLQEKLISACLMTEGLPNEIEYDLDILCYTFETVSSETAKAFYHLILDKRQHDFPIMVNLKNQLHRKPN